MIGIGISATHGNGLDFCAAELGPNQTWPEIRYVAEAIWRAFPGRTIEIPDEMTQAFLKRLNEHEPQIPDKPEMIIGEGEVPSLPRVTGPQEFGGFTLTYKQRHMIVFRYNLKLHSVEEMLREIKRTYLIEFLVRNKVASFGTNLIPDCAMETDQASFIMRQPGGGLFFNFWNHTMEDGLRERFLDSFKR